MMAENQVITLQHQTALSIRAPGHRGQEAGGLLHDFSSFIADMSCFACSPGSGQCQLSVAMLAWGHLLLLQCWL